MADLLKAIDERPGARWVADAVRVSGAKAMWAGIDFLRAPIRAMERCQQRFGANVALSLPGRSATTRKNFLILGPSYNREVLMATDVVRPSGLWSVRGPGGSAQAAIRFNYLASYGEEHESLAQTAVPHLSRAKVAAHFEAMRDTIVESIATWPVGVPIDLYRLIRTMGQQTSFSLLFGEPDPERGNTFGKLLADYHQANWRIAAHLPFDVPGSPHRQVLAGAERLCEFVREWVGEQSGCPAHQNLRAAFAAHRRPDGRSLTPRRLAAHINFLGFAAYETMSSALTWALYLLAAHPTVAADLLDEITAAPSLDSIAQRQLDGLPLLDAVVKESLRLVPPTPLLPLRPIRRATLGGNISGIVLSPHLTHRLPDLYPEARSFQPARWSRINPTAYQYLPFSAGPRRCPGYLFGTEFLKLGVAAFLPRFRLSSRGRLRVDYQFRGITIPQRSAGLELRDQDRSFRPIRMTGNIRDLVQLDS